MRFLPAAAAMLFPVALSAADPAFTPEQVKFFEAEVRPILKEHCLKCHGADEKKIRGGLRLTSREAILKGGETGPAADLKKPDASFLLLAMKNKRPDGGEVMPPSGARPEKEIAAVEKWLAMGLPVPNDFLTDEGGTPVEEKHGVVTPESRNYWAYKPVTRPEPPAVNNAAWVRTPIDRFVLAKLEAKGVRPNPQADPVMLVRRVYYDLTGLPPTPEQVDAFVKDSSPAAYAKLLDTLLDSPHYGEKWGRHWLDVVRYAESNGYERDSAKPFAWKYRDYVIRGMNADMPYDRFLTEQLAGDELPGPADTNRITATGFYRVGIWDDEPADKPQALFDGYDDLVSVVGQGVLGMTLNCARCHDHKKDPIPQADYYRFLAFFRDVRPYTYDQSMRSPAFTDVSPPEVKKQYEAALRKQQERIEEIEKAMKPIEDAAFKLMPPEEQLKVDDGKRAEVRKLVPKFLKGDEKELYAKLRAERKQLDAPPPEKMDLVLSVNHCDPRPPAVYVLPRGNPHAPPNEKLKVRPGFPAVLGAADPTIPDPAKGATTAGRRRVLAAWLVSPDNPLTPRVMMNRVWQYHFGRGIVPTANDFGKLGEPPTHPELLDWLADEFARPKTGTPWTLKRMHKLIMTSAAYTQSSAANPTAAAADPANQLLGRFPPRRLTAEEVRDSVLTASGKLKLTLYGPSVYPKIPDEVLAGQSNPGNGWLKTRGGGYDPKDPDAGNRRSVYVHVKRSLQVPVLQTHDQADTDSSCPVRYTTTVPTQALGLLNGEFANTQAAAFAARLEKEHPGDVPAQVARAVRLTTGRVPTAEEVAKDAAFVADLRTKFGLSETAALTRFALLALSANEFVYLD